MFYVKNASMQNKFGLRLQHKIICVRNLNKCTHDNDTFSGARVRNKTTVQTMNLMKGYFFG